MRTIIIVVMFAFCTACAVGISPGRKAVFEYPKDGVDEEIGKAKEQVKDNLYVPMMELKIYQTGTDTFCNAPEFLQCNSYSKDQCESKGRTFLHNCLQSSKSELGDINGKESSKILFRNSMKCMYENYMNRPDRQEVESCLNASKS